MKRLFALLLACSLMLTMLPAAVFADGEEDAEANVSALWSADIPASFVESNFYESSYSSKVEYTKYDGEDKVVYVKPEINSEDSIHFRKSLISAGIDLHAYSEGQLETTTIAGHDFVAVTGSDRTVYYGRDTNAKMSLKFTITGDQQDPDLLSFLDSFVYTLPDNGFTEAPYPWEGEHLITSPISQEAGGYTVSAVQIIGDESLLPLNIFDNRIAVTGNLMYILSQKQLCVYRLDTENNTMTLEAKYELDADYTSMAADESGRVYISKFMKNVLIYKDGEPVEGTCPAKNEMAIAKDGSFGLNFFTKDTDLKKVDLTTGETQDFILTGDVTPINVSEVMIDGDYIFMNGSAEKDINLFVADYDGNVLVDLKDDDGSSLGSITFGMKLADGYMGMDGNMREIVFWDNDGNWLGAAKASKVFGTSYPWISGFARIDDTSCYVSMSQERDDKSWDEVVVYKLTMEKQ